MTELVSIHITGRDEYYYNMDITPVITVRIVHNEYK